jgi:hypothetical protein
MRTRPLSLLVVTYGVLLASAVPTAQRAARAKVLSPEAVEKAEQEINKAAGARGIALTDAAKKALAKEALHEEATAPSAGNAPVTGALSDEKLSKLLTPLAAASAARQLDVREVESAVITSKTKEAVATLPADIRAQEQVGGKAIPANVRSKMVEDLTKQSDALSRSGLAVDAIRQRNMATLKAIDSAIGTAPITTQSYQVAMAEIFDRNVQLSILSTPAGAEVSAGGFPVGKTNINDKPFKPGWYTFKFQLTGYAEAERPFYVAPSNDSDSESFTQALSRVSASGSAPASTESGAGSSSPSSDRGFPWGYTVLGGIIVGLLIVLVTRRG